MKGETGYPSRSVDRRWGFSAGANVYEYKGTHYYREIFNLGKSTTNSIVEVSQAYQCTVIIIITVVIYS